MPYKSDAQRRFMHAKHPEIAERWDREYRDTPKRSTRYRAMESLHRKMKKGRQ